MKLGDLGTVVTLSTAYVVALLYANLFGFWGPFHVSIFSFVGVSESLTNALPFVGKQVVFAGACVGVFLLLLLSRRIQAFSLRWISKLTDGKGQLTDYAYSCAIKCWVVAGLAFLLLKGTYMARVTAVAYSVGLGLLVGAVMLRRQHIGLARVIAWAVAFAVCVLPSMVYFQASVNAHTIRQGCGWIKASADTAARLAAAAGDNIYLGYAGEHFFFFNEDSMQVLILHDSEGKPVALEPRHTDRRCRAAPGDVLRPWVMSLARRAQP